jgi:pyroglutamyl-peptidase
VEEVIQILLTGFEPFGSNDVNPTELVVRSFELYELDSLPQEILLDRVVLPVDATAPDVLDDVIRNCEYDIVLHHGLHEKAQELRVETRGRNLMDFRIPDNMGEQVVGEPIIEGGPDYLPSTFPVEAVIAGLTGAGLPVAASEDAGGYLCNMLLYRSLHFFQQEGRDVQVGFLHVPKLDVLDQKSLTAAVVTVLTACVNENDQ